MKTRTKVVTSIIAVLLSVILAFIAVTVINSNNAPMTELSATTRTIALNGSALDAQSVLNEFEDGVLTKKGTTTYFEGYKALDLSDFSEIDYISDIELEELENCKVKYNFSYDSESNIVTLAATATLPDGTMEIDEIKGVGFINERNEIDAVMNIDGEGVLLSEMRNAGAIQNCGWFANLFKAIAIAAVVVVAVAAIVVTAGTAAPAVVAAGVGVSTTVVASTVATAATIGTYAALTAALAAGVYVTVSMIENIEYNGIKYKAEELTEKKIKLLPINTYYIALATSDGKMAFCATPIPRSLAVGIMRANTLVSIYTFFDSNARGVAQEASDFMSPIYELAHGSGYFNHYHLGNLSIKGEVHSACHSHAFFGLPQF